MSGQEEHEQMLRAQLERARAAWPSLRLDEATFLRRLHAVSPDGATASALQVEDLYLAQACASGEAQAIAAFERIHLARVGQFVAQIDASPNFADEVSQHLREKLLVGTAAAPPKIAEYEGRGALGGWVRIVAQRAALNLRRQAGPRHGSLEQGLPLVGDPELVFLKRRYRADFETALREALAGISLEQRRLLRFSLLDGLTIDDIAALHRIHRATAARWLVAARAAVLEGMRQRLHARLRLSVSEFDSLFGILRSELDGSIRRVLERSR